LVPARPEPARAAPPVALPDPGAIPDRRLLLALYAVVGATSFGYELCWFRILVFYLQSATYSFSLMLTLFLLGVGLGSLVYSRLVEPRLASAGDAARVLALAQLGIGLWGAGTLHVYTGIPGVWEQLLAWLGAGSWGVIVLQKAIVSGLVILPPTLLMGVSFPLVARLYKARGATDARALSRLYAANTLGAIVGTLVTGFVFFDAIGIQATLAVLSLSSVAAGLVAGFGGLRRAPRFAAATAGATAAVIVVLVATPERVLLANFERHQGAISFYRESATDITFVYEVEGDLWLGFSDGRGTSSTSDENNYMARLSAYQAMLVKPDAKDILVISMGCGNTASGFTAFPIERLDIVDISSGPFEAAPHFHTNRRVLEDPRVHITVEDGRNFLLKSQRKYDVIELELPSLHTDGVAFLYTREFYEIARARLKEGGVISQWIDAYQTRRRPSYRLINTMREVFPEVSAWARSWSWWGLGINGRPGGAPDYERVRRLFALPAVREDLERVNSDLEDVLSTLVGYGPPLFEALGSSAPITDDRTYIDFALPKLATPASFGGGVGYYNAPLRKLFEQRWGRSGGIRRSGLMPFYAGGPDHHAAAVDRSLWAFAPGWPQDLLERVEERNGTW
jgi:predicted membrane-bound spermidine synthase